MSSLFDIRASGVNQIVQITCVSFFSQHVNV